MSDWSVSVTMRDEIGIQIHKAAGIILKERKLLVARSKGKTIFVAPGGLIEDGETSQQALVRELYEEYRITVAEEDLEVFGTFQAQAAGAEDKRLQMDVFRVKKWVGEISPDREIAAIFWLSSCVPETVTVGSIFEHEVLPRLKSEGLVD